MQHTHFAKRLPQQQQLCYTSAPAVVAQPRPPPHHSSSTSFPGLGVPLLPSSLPSLGPPVMEAVKNEPGQPSSSRRILSFGGRPPTPSTAINNYLSGGDWPDGGGFEAAAAMQQQAPERRSRAHWNTQEHVVAERKRREKMQQQFTTLATIVPDLTKTDKISLLGSTIKYVKQLEEKIGEAFSTTVELVKNLTTALRGFSTRDEEEN
nr:unnamed protein product [Digitaria exilis]